MKLCLTAASHDGLRSTRLPHRVTLGTWWAEKTLTTRSALGYSANAAETNRIRRGHRGFRLGSRQEITFFFLPPLGNSESGQIVATCAHRFTHDGSGSAASHLLTRPILIRGNGPNNTSYLHRFTYMHRKGESKHVPPLSHGLDLSRQRYPAGGGGGEKDELSFIHGLRLWER